MSLAGLSGFPIQVEVDISSQLPAFHLVGLPDASLSEAPSRVRAACTNSGFGFPSQKVVANLSPASVPKSGSGFDLAIALGVLCAASKVDQSSLNGVCALGELGLDGAVRPVPGVLPMAMAAQRAGFKRLLCALENASEAALVSDLEVYGVANLSQSVAFLNAACELEQATPLLELAQNGSELDLEQVLGQELAVDGLVVAAAGGHHLAMIGAPGSGKTMLAERLTTILPQLSISEALEVAAIESIAGTGQRELRLSQNPPFQAPHHTSSTAAIVGGGTGVPRPGAASLAHRGVLFLDEALEFRLGALDSLREPLENGRVVINRSGGSAVFPAAFQLILAANPCPCGFLGVVGKNCRCTPVSIRRYCARLSGPVFDRIDIRLPVRPVGLSAGAGIAAPSMSSAQALIKVTEARGAAAERFKKFGFRLNAQVPGQLLRRNFKLGGNANRELDLLLRGGRSSMRGYDRCLRLAWTLADLDGATLPNLSHVQRAVSLRGADDLVAT